MLLKLVLFAIPVLGIIFCLRILKNYLNPNDKNFISNIENEIKNNVKSFMQKDSGNIASQGKAILQEKFKGLPTELIDKILDTGVENLISLVFQDNSNSRSMPISDQFFTTGHFLDR